MFEYISLERTACYGHCPVYKVIIYNNGQVDYEGEMFVKVEGNHQWILKPGKIRQLSKLLEDFNYRGFKYCPAGGVVTDCPSCITEVKFTDGTKKKINHNLGYEEFEDNLEKFENSIDKIIGSKKYTYLPF